MITIKLNVSKLDKNRFFKGKKGTYCDLVLFELRDGTNEYGDDYIVKQSVSREEREKGNVDLPICGSAKNMSTGQGARRPERPATKAKDESVVDGPGETDDVPF